MRDKEVIPILSKINSLEQSNLWLIRFNQDNEVSNTLDIFF